MSSGQVGMDGQAYGLLTEASRYVGLGRTVFPRVDRRHLFALGAQEMVQPL